MNKHRKDFESISEAYLNMPALKALKLLQESQDSLEPSELTKVWDIVEQILTDNPSPDSVDHLYYEQIVPLLTQDYNADEQLLEQVWNRVKEYYNVETDVSEEDAPEDWDPKVQGKHLGPSEPGVDYDEPKPEPTEAILGNKSEMVENLIDRLEHRDKFMIADLPEIQGKGFLEIGFEDNASGAGLDIYTLKVIDYRQEE